MRGSSLGKVCGVALRRTAKEKRGFLNPKKQVQSLPPAPPHKCGPPLMFVTFTTPPTNLHWGRHVHHLRCEWCGRFVISLPEKGKDN